MAVDAAHGGASTVVTAPAQFEEGWGETVIGGAPHFFFWGGDGFCQFWVMKNGRDRNVLPSLAPTLVIKKSQATRKKRAKHSKGVLKEESNFPCKSSG